MILSPVPTLRQKKGTEKLDSISCAHVDVYKRQVYVDQYFQENVYPVLTPMAVDSSRPFPLIRNKSLNIGAMVQMCIRDRLTDRS